MPFYDFICRACGKEANVRASVAEKTEKRVPCPACGSLELETAYKNAPFSVTKSSNAPACPHRHVCGGGCRH